MLIKSSIKSYSSSKVLTTLLIGELINKVILLSGYLNTSLKMLKLLSLRIGIHSRWTILIGLVVPRLRYLLICKSLKLWSRHKLIKNFVFKDLLLIILLKYCSITLNKFKLQVCMLSLISHVSYLKNLTIYH